MCSQVRSTLVVASLQALRERGLFDRYVAHVNASFRDILIYLAPGVWLPIDVAKEHYAACDGLGLRTDEVLAIGNSVGRATQKSGMSMILHTASEGGVTPWTVFANAQRFWSRLYVGSAMSVTKHGPKDARFLAVRNPLAKYAYWRTGLRGIISAVGQPFCSKIVVAEARPPNDRESSVGYRVSWA